MTPLVAGDAQKPVQVDGGLPVGGVIGIVMALILAVLGAVGVAGFMSFGR